MAKKLLTRYIKPEAVIELWARAAGRCEFGGCNRLLYKSPVTQERVNIAEKAHVYSFSKKGPRGWGKLRKGQVNDLTNLLLVCHDCHKKIDKDKEGRRYSAELLRKWKNEHEKRVEVVTGVNPKRKSNVILYGANIGDEVSKLSSQAANDALFPNWYPAEEHPLQLSMTWEGKDDKDSYWQTEAENLRDAFNRKIRPILDGSESPHLSIFAFAPMPLLTLFGSLLTDKVPAETYQLHREPFPTWHWVKGPKNFGFKINRPARRKGPPALVISLSGIISPDRVTSVLKESPSVWELTIDRPHNDFLKSRDQLSKFREATRQLIVEIAQVHGHKTPISIFPAMPLACAVELGRVRMPKSDSPWMIYDQNNKRAQFISALEIRADNE